MRVLFNRLATFGFNKKVSYCKTGLTGPSSAVTKLGWTLFEEVYAKIGRCWQCKVDFISKKSIVRKYGPEIVLTALIVILCCTV
jgi:hypothetical protein